MAGRVVRCLQKAHLGHVSRLDCSPEIAQLVLMICLVGVRTDQRWGRRRQMVWVNSRCIELEWHVVTIIVRITDHLAANLDQAEVAVKPSPGYPGCG